MESAGVECGSNMLGIGLRLDCPARHRLVPNSVVANKSTAPAARPRTKLVSQE